MIKELKRKRVSKFRRIDSRRSGENDLSKRGEKDWHETFDMELN